MKTLCIAAALAISACTVHGNTTDPVVFDSSEYLLAASDVQSTGVVINTYLKAGESMENWTTMLTVQHHPAAGTINEAINPWLMSIRSQMAKKWSATRTPNATGESDVIVEVWVATGGLQAEAILQRFVALPSGGVQSYRFAERLDPKAPRDKEAYGKKKYRRMEELGGLDLKLVKAES